VLAIAYAQYMSHVFLCMQVTCCVASQPARCVTDCKHEHVCARLPVCRTQYSNASASLLSCKSSKVPQSSFGHQAIWEDSSAAGKDMSLLLRSSRALLPAFAAAAAASAFVYSNEAGECRCTTHNRFCGFGTPDPASPSDRSAAFSYTVTYYWV